MDTTLIGMNELSFLSKISMYILKLIWHLGERTLGTKSSLRWIETSDDPPHHTQLFVFFLKGSDWELGGGERFQEECILKQFNTANRIIKFIATYRNGNKSSRVACKIQTSHAFYTQLKHTV